MSTGTDYYNSDSTLVPKDGGAVAVTIASNAGQGNGGTSIPCKVCLVKAGFKGTGVKNGGFIRMNINTAATSILGIVVPNTMAASIGTATISIMVDTPPMRIEIDDVNKLYFWGSDDGDCVDILYRR